MASGASGVTLDSATEMLQFQQALVAVCASLAKAVVRDGEGATKFITLDIRGAASDADAHAIGNTIAASPLVKTAFFGNDANWGRIVAAAGRAGVAFDPDKARLSMVKGEVLLKDDKNEEILGLLLFEKGMPTKYKEADATATIKEQTIYVTLECGVGNGHAIVWTCDLSHDYVDINGSYRS
jgi:glutamate N-acetyltransferase / amino-acid N-acetyltransferase